jgi:hypothetical protein
MVLILVVLLVTAKIEPFYPYLWAVLVFVSIRLEFVEKEVSLNPSQGGKLLLKKIDYGVL